ncbi:MAG: DUF3106 domain-containing protein [Acidobacteria bacterium]|nr:DUF3106 domain-containing protein [Acidobacteriota bacterium]
MYLPRPTRSNAPLRQLVVAMLFGFLPLMGMAQGDHPNRGRNMPQRSGPPPQQRGGFGQPRGQHLPQWFAQRSQMTPQQREDALRHEPGFRQMSPEAQQKAMNGLQRLNQMTPQQRQRMLARNEAIERMSPDQRRAFRGALQSWKDMPPDRRKVVARSLHELRQLPPEQRGAALNAPQYHSRLTDEERRNLELMLSAEPRMP